MKAILSEVAGDPQSLVIGDVPAPKPTAGQVVVRVHACGVNYPDLLIISDRYQYRPQRPFSPGAEVAGEVVELGADVDGLAIGDRVIAMVGWGGMAEMVAADAEGCVRIPDAMPYDEAAAFIMTYGTSYHALVQRGRIAKGETLLVLGAGGGVGLAAVELGKALGARVIAAASSAEKVDLARRMGADDGIVYDPDAGTVDGKALAARFKAACGVAGADLVYDGVGGAYADPAIRALAWGGRYLVVGFPAGIPTVPLNLPLLKGADIVGVFYGGFLGKQPALAKQNNAALIDLYLAGRIKPHISQRLPLSSAALALEAIERRQVHGKIVLLVNESVPRQ